MTRIFTGTASVVNGSAVVTILTGGPLSDANAPADGSVMLDGLGYFIGERLTNSTFELTRNYEGSTGTVDCEIDPLTPKAISLFNVSREITDYNSRLALLEADGKGLFYSILGTTGASDPGAGKLARNEDAWADVTELYIDVIDAGDMEATPLINTWSAGTVVTVRSIATRAYASFTLASAATNEGSGAWRKLTGLTYLGGGGILVDDEDVAIEWNRVGATGAIGVSGGITLTFDDPTADADPGAGKFRLNNATHASATAAYIDNAEALASADISGLLDSWDDSTTTIKGTLTIASKANPAIFRTYNVTGSVVNGTGYHKVTIAYVTGAGTLADETSCTLVFSRAGNNGVDGVDGTGLFSRVRAVSTANITIATALNNGDTIDGVTLATNDLVLVAGQAAPAENGVYVVGASPARDSSSDTYDEHPGVYVSVMEGTVNADTLWRCTSNKGGTLGSTALVFSQFTSGLPSVAASASGPASIDFAEDTDNGSNKVTLKAPASLASDAAVTLPSSAGTLARVEDIMAAGMGRLFGLTLSNNVTDAANDIDIASGLAADASDGSLMTLASALTKRLDAAWAVGTNQGGLDTGSKANSTWYYVWCIKRTDTGVVDVLFSTSATAPTMPSGYTLKRRLPGAVRTDGSGSIRAFMQRGKEFHYKTPVADAAAATLNTTRTLLTVTVPPGMTGRFRVLAYSASGAIDAMVHPTYETDAGPLYNGSPGILLSSPSTNRGSSAEYFIPTDASSQIALRASAASTYTCVTASFIDNES